MSQTLERHVSFLLYKFVPIGNRKRIEFLLVNYGGKDGWSIPYGKFFDEKEALEEACARIFLEQTNVDLNGVVPWKRIDLVKTYSTNRKLIWAYAYRSDYFVIEELELKSATRKIRGYRFFPFKEAIKHLKANDASVIECLMANKRDVVDEWSHILMTEVMKEINEPHDPVSPLDHLEL